MEEHLFSRILCVFGLVAALAIGAPVASAAVVWTDGATGNSDWSDPANWGGAVPGAGDTAEFASSGNQANLDASQSVNAVSFTGSTGGFTIGGGANQLTLGSGNITTAGTGHTHTIDIGTLQITDGSTTFSAGAGDLLVISAALDNDAMLDGLTYQGPGTIELAGGVDTRGHHSVASGVTILSGGSYATDIVTIQSGAELRVTTTTGQLRASTTVNAGGLLTFQADQGRNITALEMKGGEVKLDGADIGDWGGLSNTFLRYTAGSGEQAKVTGTGRIVLGDRSFSRTIAVDDDAGLDVDMRIDAVINNPGRELVKGGAGTLELNGNNTGTGTTTISNGTLLVNGTTGPQGEYSIAAGATLGGTGTISAAVSAAAGGILAPGASVGTLNVANNDVSLVDAILAIELDAALADLLSVDSGALDLSGADVQVAELTAPTAGEYLIATATGGVTLSGTTVSGDGAWALELRNSDTELYLVPEPGTMALLGLGGLGILLRRRRG